MARIRSIKPQYFQHEALYEAEVQSGMLPLRLAYIGLWTQCDNRGYFKWRPPQLKLNVLPYDTCDFSEVMAALADHGFIVKYQVGDEFFGYIPTFLKHQRPHVKELPDKGIPPPPSAIVLGHSQKPGASTGSDRGRTGADTVPAPVQHGASTLVDGSGNGSWRMDHGSGNGSTEPRAVLKQETGSIKEHNPQTCRDPLCCSDGMARAAAEMRTPTS